MIEGIFKLPLIIKNERKPLKKWYLGRIYPSGVQTIKIIIAKWGKKNEK